MFAMMHISNPELSVLGPGLLLYYFMAGVFLSLLTVQDDGLELAMAFHIFNNLFPFTWTTTRLLHLFVNSNYKCENFEAIEDKEPDMNLLFTIVTMAALVLASFFYLF